MGVAGTKTAVDSLSALISALALTTSAITLWLTFLRRGTVKMTPPRQIFLGPDGPQHQGQPKVVLRTILFSTAKRGRFVEGMHVALFKGEAKQNFPVWVLSNEGVALGSGLFVGENGYSAHHHFLTLDENAIFDSMLVATGWKFSPSCLGSHRIFFCSNKTFKSRRLRARNWLSRTPESFSIGVRIPQNTSPA